VLRLKTCVPHQIATIFEAPMATYILQRVLQMIPVMIMATIISFSIIFLLPGDPALLILGDQLAADRSIYEAKRAELGLDRPLPIQYLDWLGKTLRGDLGLSTRDRQPVAQGIKERLPVTLQLAGLGLLLALVISIPAGIISALKPGSKWDIMASLFAFSGIALPNFVRHPADLLVRRDPALAAAIWVRAVLR